MDSLSQIPIASGAALKPVVLGGAQALGVERFEGASVAADLNLPFARVLVGSELTFDLDIANVGAMYATLVKIEEVAPKELKIIPEKTPHLTGEDYIDLEGKRLGRLKTHKVRIALAATRKGIYAIQPKIFFADDRGNYMSYQTKPMSVTVLEEDQSPVGTSQLEIIPPNVVIPEGFRFDSERARKVFERLVNEFLKDYVSKKLHMDNAGWRSLMEMIRESEIPRSSLYGPSGKIGPVLAELERRRLVEVRVFPGERGRGGAVRKIRVAYDNVIVKDIIQRSVMGPTSDRT